MPLFSPNRLWNRDFVRWLIGVAGAALGDAVIYVALPFLVMAQGGDAAAVAATFVAASLPRFFGPLLGVGADRWPLRWPVSLAAAGRGAAFAALGAAALAGPLPLGLIWAAAFVNGALALFVFTAGEVALPRLVPRSELQRANSWLQGALLGLPLIGLAAGGALVSLLGAGGAIVLATAAFVPLAALAPTIRFPPVAAPNARDEGGLPSIGRDLLRGARFLGSSGPLLVVCLASLLVNAGLNLINVTVPLAMERRGFGAGGFGAFEGSISVGVLLGLVLAGALAERLAPRWQIALGTLLLVGGFGALGLAFGRHDAPLWALAAAAVPVGLGLGVTEVSAITLLQLAIPDGLRGKVLGTLFTVNAAGLALGAALAGRFEPALGAPALYFAAGGTTLAVALLWIFGVALRPAALERLLERAALSLPESASTAPQPVPV